MPDYKCECNEEVVNKSGITIKYVEGKGAIHDVECSKCGEYMELANPKSGAPSFRSNRFGQTFALALASSILLMSCSTQNHYRYKQSSKYNQCWCLDPWNGAAEWCCPGEPTKTMNPYSHNKGYVRARF
tara:strand:- start:129 stop:515 length:387 start_codon:yes stop_codon:yes gene_type:complete